MIPASKHNLSNKKNTKFDTQLTNIYRYLVPIRDMTYSIIIIKIGLQLTEIYLFNLNLMNYSAH